MKRESREQRHKALRKVKTTGSSQRLDLGISRERGRRRMFISREERLFEQKFKRKIKCLFQGEGKRRKLE